MDQSLAAAFDVDVIGGLSRLSGSALGSSNTVKYIVNIKKKTKCKSLLNRLASH